MPAPNPHPPRSFASDLRWLESIGRADNGRLVLIHGPGRDCVIPVAKFGRAALGARIALGPRSRSVSLLDVELPPDRPDALHDCADVIRCDGFRFARVRRRSRLLATLPRSGLRYALSDAGGDAYCDVSRPDALKALSKEHLHNVDRLRRRAERTYGALAIERVTDVAAVHTGAFDRFVALEDAGWKGSAGAGTSLAADTRAQRFHREVMRSFGEDQRARIDFLTIGGRDAAAQLMVRSDDTWYLLKIGFHPDFKDVGPGGILLKAFLEEMVADPGINEVNLTTNPAWAARWHFPVEPVYTVFVYNTTWRGRALYAARSVKELAKRLRDAARRQ